MKTINQLVIIFIAIIFLQPQLRAESLIEIYREALEYDSQYKIARHAYIASQEKLTQGRAGLLPTIDVTGRARNMLLDTERTDGENYIKNRGVVVTATQPIFRIENFIIYQQSKNEVAQGEAQFILAAQDLILRVAQTYFDALIAKVNVEAIEAQEKASRQQLEQMRYNLQSGLNTIVDLNEAEARHDLVVSQEIVARNILEISNRSFQAILNRAPRIMPNINLEKIVSDALVSPQDSMDEWILLAEQKNIPLKIQQIAYELAQQETSKAKSKHYPTLDLVGQYSNQLDNPFVVLGRGLDFESKMVGIELKIPIFHGFATQSHVRETLANQDKAREELENKRRIIGLQVQKHYLELTASIAKVKALKKALISSQSQLDATVLGRESGIRIEIDVLNAQQQYYSARKDLAITYYNYCLARLRLKADIGALDESALEEINGLL